MKICSFNIRYENEQDGTNHWNSRLPFIREFFSQYDIALLGTQEGRKKQIENLAENINLKPITSHRDWIENRMYPTLYINENELKVIQSGDYWLSETPEIPGSSSFKSAFPRLVTWAIIERCEKQFFVTNFHLDHVLEETREEQIKIGIKCIIKNNPNHLPLIIMGDFNDHPNSKTRKILNDAYDLIDPWLENNLPEETSHHAFLGSKSNGSRIDWILHSKEFQNKNIELIKMHKDNLYLSDHYPLIATLIPN